MRQTEADCCGPLTISEEDILQAMRDIPGYLDISPGDFKEVFQVAYRHAVSRLVDSRTAAEIMTGRVHCVDAAMDLRQVAAFLAEKKISGAPVIDGGDGKVVGVVSEKDFLQRMGLGKTATFMEIIARCLDSKGCIASALLNHGIAEIMSAPPITAGPDITIGAIAALFSDKRINRLPIVDGEGRPVGIITRTDLVNSYCLSSK